VIGIAQSLLLPRRTASTKEGEQPPFPAVDPSLENAPPREQRKGVSEAMGVGAEVSEGPGVRSGGWAHPSTGFALLLILTGALLTLGPEFVYLRDVFGQRLNTVFKFYYAAWILWALASAYATYWIVSHAHPILGLTFAAVLGILVVSAMVYPAFAIPSRANFAAGPDSGLPTLDGIAFIRRQYPADYAGIEWLWGNAGPGDVVLEAIGGQYSYYGRVSMATGIPTVMGWPGHESQWRGSLYPQLAGTREQDVREIYNTPNVLAAQELLNRYGVTYVFVGTLERNSDYASPVGLAKFDRSLPIAFQTEGVTIYRADQPLIEEPAP
jgi:uncharacterized membrane protein